MFLKGTESVFLSQLNLIMRDDNYNNIIVMSQLIAANLTEFATACMIAACSH